MAVAGVLCGRTRASSCECERVSVTACVTFGRERKRKTWPLFEQIKRPDLLHH